MKSSSEITRTFAFLAVLCTSPLFFLLNYLGDPGKGKGAWCCAATVVIIIKSQWDLRNRLWFWITIFLGIALQVPFVLLVPWASIHPGMALVPIGALDICVVYGSIKLVEKVMTRGATEGTKQEQMRTEAGLK